MASKMMTKTQAVPHFAKKVALPKKTVVTVLKEHVAITTKEARATERFVVSGLRKAGRAVRNA